MPCQWSEGKHKHQCFLTQAADNFKTASYLTRILNISCRAKPARTAIQAEQSICRLHPSEVRFFPHTSTFHHQSLPCNKQNVYHWYICNAECFFADFVLWASSAPTTVHRRIEQSGHRQASTQQAYGWSYAYEIFLPQQVCQMNKVQWVLCRKRAVLWQYTRDRQLLCTTMYTNSSV